MAHCTQTPWPKVNAALAYRLLTHEMLGNDGLSTQNVKQSTTETTLKRRLPRRRSTVVSAWLALPGRCKINSQDNGSQGAPLGTIDHTPESVT